MHCFYLWNTPNMYTTFGVTNSSNEARIYSLFGQHCGSIIFQNPEAEVKSLRGQ